MEGLGTLSTETTIIRVECFEQFGAIQTLLHHDSIFYSNRSIITSCNMTLEFVNCLTSNITSS